MLAQEGKRIIRCFGFFLIVLFAGRTGVALATQGPNLVLYQPAGWSSVITVSKEKNTTVDSPILSASDPLYISMAIANTGIASTPASAGIAIYRDGAPWWSGQINVEINGGTYLPVIGYPVGSLSAGSHTITIVLDPDKTVEETDESDNIHIRTLTVAESGTAHGTLTSCPSGYDFGPVETATRTTRFFLLSNTGKGFLDIGSVRLEGPDPGSFHVFQEGCSGSTFPSVESLDTYAGTCRLVVTFSPDSPGSRSAVIRIASSDPDTPDLSIPLTGTGVQPPEGPRAPGDIDGDRAVGLNDGILALGFATGKFPLSAPAIDADTDDDGRIGVKDAIYVMRDMVRPDPPVVYDTVRIRTRLGDMIIWLYDQTPLHKENFLSLVEAGFYNGLIFHRVINDFMIQGGDPLGTGSGGPGYTIEAEIDCSLPHVYGAVAAARQGDAVNPERRSSGSQFYIVENHYGTPFLDNNYTVFGQVINGLEVTDAIADQPTDAADRPVEEIRMTTVEIVSLTAGQLFTRYGFTVPGP